MAKKTYDIKDILSERDYTEVEYNLTIRTKSGVHMPLSKFHEFTKKIEDMASKDEFLVVIEQLDSLKGPDKYEDMD